MTEAYPLVPQLRRRVYWTVLLPWSENYIARSLFEHKQGAVLCLRTICRENNWSLAEARRQGVRVAAIVVELKSAHRLWSEAKKIADAYPGV